VKLYVAHHVEVPGWGVISVLPEEFMVSTNFSELLLGHGPVHDTAWPVT